jgi:putative DNA primase/helicase
MKKASASGMRNQWRRKTEVRPVRSFQEIHESAKNKWRGILVNVGINQKYLVKKHGPCPICHGKDRFRFDDKGGEGTWICSNCGSGYGSVLAQKYLGKGYRETMMEIDEILNGKPIKSDPVKPEMTDEQRRGLLRDLWRQTKPMQKGDLADQYLTARGVGQVAYVEDLRFGEHVKDGEGGVHPVMVAIVRAPDGKPSTMHRTFLDRSGKKKAQVQAPRKMMAGGIAVGSCVRLMDWVEGSALGVAEGIETAFAASKQFGVPVWAALNAHMLETWEWPKGCEEILIFADSDANFVGQSAAFSLAKRAALKGVRVHVYAPGLTIERDFLGTDFQDLMETPQ